MERLTRRISEDCIELSAKANPTQYQNNPQRIYKNHPFWNVFNKLCEQEDAEEQGLLLRLPCNVGDIVWFIGSKCDKCEKDYCYRCPYNLSGDKRNERFLYEMTVKQFRVRNSTIYLVDTDAISASNEMSFNVNQIGKTVFLTKEEAEQKLASMQKGE